MKYLYYSLYLFYVKVLHVHKDFPPIINIVGVMSFLIVALCFSIVNAYKDDMGHRSPTYSVLIPFLLFAILYKILYCYYNKRESDLLKEMQEKSLWVKIASMIISFFFIALVVKLWMLDGMNNVYQFVKRQLFM